MPEPSDAAPSRTYLDADERGGSGPNGKPSLTVDAAVSQLTRESAGWDGGGGRPVTLTYGFRAEATGMPSEIGGFSRFTPEQIATTTLVLRAWADVANITFVRIGAGTEGDSAYTNQATILFGDYATGLEDHAAAFASYPGSRAASAESGDVWVNITLDQNRETTPMGRAGNTLAHEIGHALGLSHPAAYPENVDASVVGYQTFANYFEDNRQYTVMTYFPAASIGTTLPGFPSGPQLDDIAAVQRLYGANLATRVGDTVYGFHSNADRPWLMTDGEATKMVAATWDAGGHDTLDFSGYADAQAIDLRPGAFSDVGGLNGNIAVAMGADLEDAIGGTGADTVTGNALANLLDGHGGAARILAGAGADTIVQGGAGESYLRGEEGADSIVGGADFDDINGNQGDDTAAGGAGADWVVGGKDNDRLAGDGGDDLVLGNLGADTLGGGAGADTIRGGQEGDLLVGGDGADWLSGDRGDDTLTGGAGADIFHSFAGADLDRVLDFDRAEGDRVLLDPGTTWRVSQLGEDSAIDLEGGGHVLLVGVATSSLTGDWIGTL